MSPANPLFFLIAYTHLEGFEGLCVDGLVDFCPSCHMMFDMRLGSLGATVGARLDLPVVYYLQLLGLAMRIDVERLGLHLNTSSVDGLLEKIVW